MSTDIDTFEDDELVIPHFEEELWQVLAEAHEDRRHGTVRLTAAVDTAHRRRGRGLVMAGIGAAAAAATLVVALSLRDDTSTPSTPDEATAIPADLAAKISAASAEAEATMIVVSMSNYGGKAYEAWQDEASGSLRMVIRNAAGKVVSDAHPNAVPTDGPSDHQAVAFNYCNNTYTEVTGIIDGQPNSSVADSIRQGLDEGWIVADRTEVIDGKELIRLVEVAPDPSTATTVTIVENGEVVGHSEGTPDDAPLVASGRVTWVDPETYRPVKIHDDDIGMDQTYEYLERTPENLAQMSPPVPPGFTHTDPPLGGIPPMPDC
jgi:hypothetical protein